MSETCEALVKRTDPGRYFSALFAPKDKRPFLFALYAFNHEIARVGETVREPMVVLDSDLKILTANHSFYETFKVTPEEAKDLVKAMRAFKK